jgi:hypothetical protein
MKNFAIRATAAASAFAPAFAFADAPDVSALVTTINGTLTPVGLVGLAGLTLLVGIRVYHFIRRAL